MTTPRWDQLDLGVVSAPEIPVATARERSSYVEHVNGHRLSVAPGLATLDGVVDVTSRLSAALDSIDAPPAPSS